MTYIIISKLYNNCL